MTWLRRLTHFLLVRRERPWQAADQWQEGREQQSVLSLNRYRRRLAHDCHVLRTCR